MFGGRTAVAGSDVQYRLEVFTQTGSEGYGLMGLTKEQVINDVLDRYEAHLAFLRYSTEHDYASTLTPPKPSLPSETSTIPPTRPTTWKHREAGRAAPRPSSHVAAHCLLADNGHVDSAATSLGVHRHPLRSRIAKISEVTGQDPDSAHTRAEIRIAFQVREQNPQVTTIRRTSERLSSADRHTP
jgi:hypothetical protein